MANTKGLEPAASLPIGRGDYGPQATYARTSHGASIYNREGVQLAFVGSDGVVDVSVSELTSATVTPVNVFLAPKHRVLKNWRTGVYELKVEGVAAPIAKAVKAPRAPKVTPVAPIVEAPAPVVPAPTPVAARVDPVGIPALERPERRAIKAVGRGYTRIGEIITSSENLAQMEDALVARRAGFPAGVLITGPAGTAKTRLVEAFAGAKGLPLVRISGGKIRSADDWFGGWGKDVDGKLTWRPSPLTQVMDAGIECVVLIDEINRAESERALNGLFNVLDESGTTFIPDANRSVTMPKGVLVMATANIGPEFVGTIPLDGALRDRLPWGVRMAYPVEVLEIKLLTDMTGVDADTAGRLVRVANAQRAKRMDPLAYPSRGVISTRVLLDVARRITLTGRDPREALWGALRGRFSPDDEPSLKVCVDAQFATPVVEDDEITEVDLLAF